MSKKLIENLKGRIAMDEQHRGNPEQASWREEDGVLLSRNEAKQCLAALEGREQALNASVSAVYFADGSDFLTYHYQVIAALTRNDNPDREEIEQMFAELNPTT